jgi:glutaredoxin 3
MMSIVLSVSALFLTFPTQSTAFLSPSFVKIDESKVRIPTVTLESMKRPILDQIATALYRMETARVESSSQLDDNGRYGEPMEWSESNSLPNLVSEWIASNPLGYILKQMVADIIAGNDFDKDATMKLIDTFISENNVAMFSFTSCPFCRKAKDLLVEKGIEFQAMELDQLEGNLGNQIRACLGRKTKRTSVPSIFIGGNYIGGCNDGPGLLPLAANGTLDQLLANL